MAQTAQSKNNELMVVNYQLPSGENMSLDAQTVKSYLVNGQGHLSDQEVMMFMNLCKFQKLNPFLKECYCIKYSDNDPATIVTGKEAFLKRAESHPDYRGKEDGVIVVDKAGNVVERKGALVLPSDKLVGGWAKVYRKGYEKPIEVAVSLEEYIGKKKDGSPNQNWAGRPATMIRKVAIVQALREAFPQNLGGMYTEEEVDAGKTEPAIDVEKVYDINEAEEPRDAIIVEATVEPTQNDATKEVDDGGFWIDYGEYKNNKEQYDMAPLPGHEKAYDADTRKIRVRRK